MLDGHIGYPPGLIAVFCLVVIVCIIADLYLHRSDKPVSLSDAALWSAVWVVVSLGFYGYLWGQYGEAHAALFLAGYALEKVLSIDNLMVFLAIFSAFAVPEHYRHRILYYGVIGAVLFRLVFVLIGTWIYELGPWVEVLFALVIAWTGIKMLQSQHDSGDITDYTHHWSVRLTSRLIPVYPRLAGHNFFVGPRTVARHEAEAGASPSPRLRQARLYATPLLLCLVCIEMADVVFAFDSVPAIIAVTKEPLLVYSAMIFAILGLRSLYFVLAALQRHLVHLGTAVVVLLFFIAFKLLLSACNHLLGWPGFEFDPNLSLAVVLGVLATGIAASFAFPVKETR